MHTIQVTAYLYQRLQHEVCFKPFVQLLTSSVYHLQVIATDIHRLVFVLEEMDQWSPCLRVGRKPTEEVHNVLVFRPTKDEVERLLHQLRVLRRAHRQSKKYRYEFYKT
jgi:hypothetical protein